MNYKFKYINFNYMPIKLFISIKEEKKDLKFNSI